MSLLLSFSNDFLFFITSNKFAILSSSSLKLLIEYKYPFKSMLFLGKVNALFLSS